MNEIHKSGFVLLTEQTTAEITVSDETDSSASGEDSLSSDETTQVVPETEAAILQNTEIYQTNMTNLSIGILVALGLMIGIQMGKIFLDKIWR